MTSPVPSHCQAGFHCAPTAPTPFPKFLFRNNLSCFSVFSDYQRSCYEHAFTSLSPDMYFHFSWVNNKKWNFCVEQ